MYNGFYYFTRSRNFKNILENGIISRNSIIKSNIDFSDFSNSEVQARRHFKRINVRGNEYYLHDFVPLSFIPKTPTLSAIKHLQDDLIFIEINKNILSDEKIYLFADGNAASDKTKFIESVEEARKNISWEVIYAQNWTNFDDGKRKRSAEILIYDRIEPKFFNKIIVNNELLNKKIEIFFSKFNFNGLNNDLKYGIDSTFFF